jgi:hypothetical protein
VALAFLGLDRVSFSKISRYSVVIGTISHGFMSCLVAYVPWKSCRPAIVMCDAACLSEGVFSFFHFVGFLLRYFFC